MIRRMYSIFRIVTLYVVFSVLWVYFSDRFLLAMQQRYAVPEIFATYKGWAFILVSGVLLFLLLYRDKRLQEADYSAHLQEKEALINEVRAKNEELLEAYDKTILGWSRVLELRSREVKDHSARVTALTLRLARAVGCRDEDLAHIRRGALLHDIGKMAIDDSIILKNGMLTEEELALMRRHPLFGFEMVSEIEFLRPAIDIMLCHHEKWNGEGYPFGLAGEQIPFFARIFAIADVWDAMVYDRPYREAQSIESVKTYLKSQAGQHFDPHLVAVFLKMVEEEGYELQE